MVTLNLFPGSSDAVEGGWNATSDVGKLFANAVQMSFVQTQCPSDPNVKNALIYTDGDINGTRCLPHVLLCRILLTARRC